MTNEVRLEDIQASLSTWARNEAALKDQVRLLKGRVEELVLEIKHAVEQGQDSFGLPRNPDMTMRLVIEEAVLAAQARGAEQVRVIASQKEQIDNQAARILGMEQEVRESIEAIMEEMELPPNKNRTLRNAVHDACSMVGEAKKMIQENL